ncbi:hypothetical protein TNCV_1295771 [Trichonephila clavipes]|uniref:Transposase n=1 Tax=Trichonephila clavipes TaxID=2585209 RepID=A0A8X6SID2_TRICX|nr:hypothetical protein TNCV_1295771 [Trichonephila clavipes]
MYPSAEPLSSKSKPGLFDSRKYSCRISKKKGVTTKGVEEVKLQQNKKYRLGTDDPTQLRTRRRVSTSNGDQTRTNGQQGSTVYLGLEKNHLLGVVSAWQTLNSKFYCQQLERLKIEIDQKWTELANRRVVVFQQDNAGPHTSVD